VYRGIAAYCTACGQPRLPLVAKSVNMAGQTSQVGGTLTRVVGWTILFGGLAISLLVFGILAAIVPALWIAVVVGLPLAIMTVVASRALVRSGRTLEQTGASEQLSTRVEAVIALAKNRRGLLSAADVSASLGIGFTQADALLTELAKKHPDLVAVEIDDKGGVFYRVDQPQVRIGEGRLEREIDQAYAEAAEAQQPPSPRSARVR
jgi:hypothetical protein